MRTLSVIFIAGLFLAGCGSRQDESLPILGERTLHEKEVDGKTVLDTVYHTIGPFQFVDQDSSVVNNGTFKNKIYVADFFFTSCQTICPKMDAQMRRVYDSISNMPDVMLLSHTIDPEYDTVALLHDFARRLGVTSAKWHFVTGNQDSIYSIAQRSYFVTAMEDKTEPGGFIHSGAFLLVDKNGRIRGKYDGTVPEDVDRMIKDIHILRREDGKSV